MEKLINLNYFALDKKSCLQDMVSLFAENGITSSEKDFLEKVYEREDMMSTGIGRHIAIPHARCSKVDQLAIAFFRLTNNLDFDSIDDEPVKLIFMIAIPESMNQDYMKILKAISNFCHDSDNLDRLYSVQDITEANQLLSKIVENFLADTKSSGGNR